MEIMILGNAAIKAGIICGIASIIALNKEMPAYKYIRDISITDKELIKTTTQKTKRAEEMKTVL